MAKVTVRGGLILAGEGQTANLFLLEFQFGGDRKTIEKLCVHRTKLRTSQRKLRIFLCLIQQYMTRNPNKWVANLCIHESCVVPKIIVL